jgi:nitric oxide reductase NorE protein
MRHAAGTVAATGDVDKGRPGASGYLPGEPSMWFFIIGDLLIFGVYFVCYMIYRGQNHEIFLEGQQQLNQQVAALNTVVLLTSSLCVALGTEAARAEKNADALGLFRAAFVVGALFPLLKVSAWIPEIRAGLTPGKNLFFIFYYVMTGLHLVHVLAGLTLMAFVMNNLRTAPHPSVRFVETGAMYWHMVDVLWLVLFAVFYVMR